MSLTLHSFEMVLLTYSVRMTNMQSVSFMVQKMAKFKFTTDSQSNRQDKTNMFASIHSRHYNYENFSGSSIQSLFPFY